MIDKTHIEIYKSIFKGREDVFAIRWEKGDKSGYMPSYQFDPYQYRLHSVKGGSFKDFKDKTYNLLTDDQIAKHLKGEQLIGMYPLLTDNTSFFIAADFDKENWIDECRRFIRICNDHNVPAYLERSRSGNGGHVWIFFDQPYPAYKSRRVFIDFLKLTGTFSIFDKESSFDRLFPNQDYLSGKGLGNLIALPLHRPAIGKGNSCFIDVDTLQPFDNQWEFLSKIKKLSIVDLEKIYDSVLGKSNSTILTDESNVRNAKLTIRLSNKVTINRSGLSLPLINFLKEELNFTNNEFLIKKRMGKNTWGMEPHFKFVEEHNNEVIIPRGAIGRFLRFCKEQNVEYDFIDERNKNPSATFSSNIQLKEYQQSAFETSTKKDFGVIVAPPGSGKTVIGLAVIADKKQPALIIVHRKQLADQWADRIESFLGIPKKDIGKIGGGKSKVGKHITIALIQSLTKALSTSEIAKLEHAFGTIIIDECHHVPAETYRNVISKLHSFYMYGLTATPFRKYNDGKLIFIHLGESIAEIKAKEIKDQPKARIIVRNTSLSIPFNIKTDKIETLSKILVHDSIRNRLILDDVQTELKSGNRCIIITERKDHIETLKQYLKQFYETVTLSGDDSESVKKDKWGLLKGGNFQVLITTGQYFGEGSDLTNITRVFLAYPFSFEGKLIQYIGRVQRSKVPPTVYDYRDHKIAYLEKLFQKRDLYYRKLYSEGTLFDQPVEDTVGTIDIEQSVKIPIDQLEFRFGAVAFKHHIDKMNVVLEFEVENLAIRPEFGVLKPYFIKVLKSKNVKVNIVARFINSEPVSQVAFSSDLDKINREIIDSVRFKFVAKNILGKIPLPDGRNMLTVDQLQSGPDQSELLLKTEDELLQEIFKLQDVKHYAQLHYLAANHDKSILKIRFVLMPFSFIFLLTGKQHYHIVWETLDTEEATYIWHIEKNKQILKSKLELIDQDLGLVRSKGRQAFIETLPQNFSRIIHDYSDKRKGFVLWKDLLEERLT
ncbi:MAG: DEAD/DEAH box helicase [Cyclobacteriaceae bacterium]|nr:DEAD/DEAH box helicase [Cyclobacteriaceae bacterium]